MGWRSLAKVAMELGVTGCSRSVNTITNHSQIRNISITMLKGYFTQKTFTCPNLLLNLQDWHSSMNTQQHCWRSLIRDMSKTQVGTEAMLAGTSWTTVLNITDNEGIFWELGLGMRLNMTNPLMIQKCTIQFDSRCMSLQSHAKIHLLWLVNRNRTSRVNIPALDVTLHSHLHAFYIKHIHY